MSISIIIPVYNKYNLTLKCIQSIYQNTRDIDFEIIVVDNASTDETKEINNIFDQRTKIIRNIANLGFSKACNQGAAKSSKPNLIFLNNDTVTTPNWANALIKTHQKYENIGCVGGKLLYEDNTIQHCGVVFDRLKKPHHIYKHFHKDHPATNKERE